MRTRSRKLAIWRALPPYLGGKRRLCPLIFRELGRVVPRRLWPQLTLLDGFLGGGAVSLFAKAQGFSESIQRLGFEQLGEKPHRHDLMSFTSDIFYDISQKVRERGFFLYKELKERGIWGIQPGQTRTLKISTYAATDEQLDYVVDSLADIIRKYS